MLTRNAAFQGEDVTEILAAAVLSVQYRHVLIGAYHGINIVLIGLLVIMAWRKYTKRQLLSLLVFIVLINGLVSYGAFKEYLGPRIMHLPDHHCLYCLLQYRPISITMIGLPVPGFFLAMWPRLLCCLASEEARANLNLLIPSLLKFSAGCILVSWLMATILT
jgi:hypothetical protein